MHIEDILIEGFKSYAAETRVSLLDRSFNAITGFNGSGKSNILDAICFVLGISSLSRIRVTNFSELIYKQGNAGITKAAVSLRFDNSDKASSPPGYEHLDTIVVSRQIPKNGNTRYLLNNTLAKQKTIKAMFRSIGLNVDTAGFLIMQGRITKILSMKPLETLALLEETVGTSVYEQNRAQCVKTFENKEVKVREVTDSLNSEILPTIEKLDRERRAACEFNQCSRVLSGVDILRRCQVVLSMAQAARLSCDGLCEDRAALARLREEMHDLEGSVQREVAELTRLEASLASERSAADERLKGLEAGLDACSTREALAAEKRAYEEKAVLALQEAAEKRAQSLRGLEGRIAALQKTLGDESSRQDIQQFVAEIAAIQERIRDLETDITLRTSASLGFEDLRLRYASLREGARGEGPAGEEGSATLDILQAVFPTERRRETTSPGNYLSVTEIVSALEQQAIAANGDSKYLSTRLGGLRVDRNKLRADIASSSSADSALLADVKTSFVALQADCRKLFEELRRLSDLREKGTADARKILVEVDTLVGGGEGGGAEGGARPGLEAVVAELLGAAVSPESVGQIQSLMETLVSTLGPQRPRLLAAKSALQRLAERSNRDLVSAAEKAVATTHQTLLGLCNSGSARNAAPVLGMLRSVPEKARSQYELLGVAVNFIQLNRDVVRLVCKDSADATPRLLRCLELAAGPKLFHIVFRSSSGASGFVGNKALCTQRITAVPLDSMSVRTISDGARRLLERKGGTLAKACVSLAPFQDALAGSPGCVLDYVFGHTVICSTIEQARDIAYDRALGLRCITLDGDIVDPSGGINGGSRGASAARTGENVFDAFHAYVAATEAAEALERAASGHAGPAHADATSECIEVLDRALSQWGLLDMSSKRLENDAERYAGESSTARLEDLLRQKEAEICAAERDLGATKARLDLLGHMKEDLRTLLRAAEAPGKGDAKALAGQLASEKAQRGRLQDALARIQSKTRVDDIAGEIAGLQDEAQAVRHATGEKVEDLAAAQARLGALAGELAAARAEAQELSAAIRGVEAQLGARGEALREAQGRVDRLAEGLTRTTRELEERSAHLGRLRSAAVDAVGGVAAYLDEMDAVAAQLHGDTGADRRKTRAAVTAGLVVHILLRHSPFPDTCEALFGTPELAATKTPALQRLRRYVEAGQEERMAAEVARLCENLQGSRHVREYLYGAAAGAAPGEGATDCDALLRALISAQGCGGGSGGAGSRRQSAHAHTHALARGGPPLEGLCASLKAQLAEHKLAAGTSTSTSVEYDELKRNAAHLVEMRDRIIADKERVLAMIGRIDSRKVESITGVFHSVNRSMNEIFGLLLPGSGAALEPVNPASICDGLQFCVRLGSTRTGLSGLSGGQKSLLALSLILALLLYKPSPFYILDEIDSALDLNHTQNIGKLIKEKFPQSQFIVVSLKDGLFNNANVLYRTRNVAGISSIERIARPLK